ARGPSRSRTEAGGEDAPGRSRCTRTGLPAAPPVFPGHGGAAEPTGTRWRGQYTDPQDVAVVHTRTARTDATGGSADGPGRVELSSSGLGTYTVSFPTRSAEKADGATSPEELLAAAHSSCFAMQLSALLGEAGAQVQALEVSADVSLGPDDPGFKLTGITL